MHRLAATLCQNLGNHRKSLYCFPCGGQEGGVGPGLVGLSLRAISPPCNMRGDTLILPNMCGAFGEVEGGAEERREEERERTQTEAEGKRCISLSFSKWRATTGPCLCGRPFQTISPELARCLFLHSFPFCFRVRDSLLFSSLKKTRD